MQGGRVSQGRGVLNGNTNALVKVDMGEGRVVAVEARNVSPEQPVGIRDVLSFDGVAEWSRCNGHRIGAVLRLQLVRPVSFDGMTTSSFNRE